MSIKRLLVKFRQWTRSIVLMLAVAGALMCLVMALSSLNGIPITVNPEWGSLTSYVALACGGIGIVAVMLEFYLSFAGLFRSRGKRKTSLGTRKAQAGRFAKHRWYVLVGLAVIYTMWRF